jgi:hypothetical protein
MTASYCSSGWQAPTAPATPFSRPKPEPAFFDLDEAGRREAYELGVVTRRLEAAMDPDGLSATGRAVLRRIVAPDKP